MKFEFSTANAVTLWRPLDDAVMGGVSSRRG